MQANAERPRHPEDASQPLSGADSFFMDIETDECPLSMGLLVTISNTSAEAVEQRIRDTAVTDSSIARICRQKIRSGLWGIHHPRWINAADFNIDDHIIRHELQAPVDGRAFNALVADIAQRRLPRSRPLWELHIVAGLDGGDVAVIARLHHAMADGVLGIRLLMQILGLPTPRDRGGSDAGENPQGGTDADTAASRATRRQLNLPARLFFALLAALSLRLVFLTRHLFRQKLKDASDATPRTRFNTLLTGERSYTHGRLPLDLVRKICGQLDCSRNDVFLATISGALRGYLKEQGELPDRALYTGLPLVLPAQERRIGAANQLTFYRSSLATNVADPVKRLGIIKQRLRRATLKAQGNWNERLPERLTMLPPRAIHAIASLYIKLLGKGLVRPNVNVVSTLLPGPAKATALAGGSIDGFYPISIPYHGAGLFISAMRYQDALHFGIIADRQQLPDPDHLAELMQQSLAQLAEMTNK